MNRCMHLGAACALAATAALASLLPASPAFAQGIVREAPRDVKLAKMTVDLPPQIKLDDKPDMLSPGSRIRDLNNMVVLSGSLSGKTVPVVYRRDSAGLVHEVWILTADEYAKLGGAKPGSEGVQSFQAVLAAIFGVR